MIRERGKLNMGKLRIGVFGAGRGCTMINILLSHPDAEVVAICDKYRPLLEKAGKTAEENGVSVALFENFEDFFKYDMDAVVLANYASEHVPFAVRFLESGRHVMSECLTCASMAQAVQLIEAVEKSGKVYAYAENYCYQDTTFEMWRSCEEGEIGDIIYAQGEYVHDCTGEWHTLTQGDPKHWRNNCFSTFYCTHGIAPVLTMTGLRPVKVSGFESGCAKYTQACGLRDATLGMEIITLENGAVARCINGNLRHHNPAGINSSYIVYGEKGMIESSRYKGCTLEKYTVSEGCTEYTPGKRVEGELAKKFNTHGGADFYPTHFFIEKILGNEIGRKYSIDVYKAVDMCICGILAYRSILNNNMSVDVPDLRDPAQRDKYRDDHACTFVYEAGDQLLPNNSSGVVISDDAECYKAMRERWEASQKK